MSERKVVVPDGMLEAALGILTIGDPDTWRPIFRNILAAALRWLSANPSELTDEMWHQVSWDGKATIVTRETINGLLRFVFSRMFLAPEPEAPEEIRDLLVLRAEEMPLLKQINVNILEAFRRGQKAARP
jgi:hypothetical protein